MMEPAKQWYVQGGIPAQPPLLKWCGGKTKLAPAIDEAFGGPCRGRYIEPFLGSGSVFLYRVAAGRVSASNVALSDVNAKLMSFHRAVRDQWLSVSSCLALLPWTGPWRDAYTEIRAAFNAPGQSEIAQAARFVWLNKACFNGLYRENKAGHFNVPIGSYKTLSLPTPVHFGEVSRALQGAHLTARSFATAMLDVVAGDQVYCDPPYVPLNQTASFTTYSAGGFGQVQQKDLAVAARVAVKRGARVVLSNHDLPIVRELYEGFEFRELQVKRSVSCKGASRKPVGELLIIGGPT